MPLPTPTRMPSAETRQTMFETRTFSQTLAGSFRRAGAPRIAIASSPVTMSQSPIVTLRQESTSKPSVLRLSRPLRMVTPPTVTFAHPWKKQLQQLMSRNVTSRTATSRHSMNTISCPGRPW